MSGPTVYRGVFPIGPTPFHTDESVDEEGMRRGIDFIIVVGVDGIYILANHSKQFAPKDAERDHLQAICLEQADGRVPVIVTTSHYSTRIAAERSRSAQAAA